MGIYGHRRCRYQTGCRYPRPRLEELDAAAFFVFQNCEGAPGFWHWFVHPFGGMVRTGLIYSEVERSAARHGFVMDGDFEDRVRDMEQWVLREDGRRRKLAESRKAATAPADESVN